MSRCCSDGAPGVPSTAEPSESTRFQKSEASIAAKIQSEEGRKEQGREFFQSENPL